MQKTQTAAGYLATQRFPSHPGFFFFHTLSPEIDSEFTENKGWCARQLCLYLYQDYSLIFAEGRSRLYL